MTEPAPIVDGRHLPRKDLRFDADAVVVGSGAGGAVVATELAEAGLDVVVLEEGGHTPPEVYGSLRPSESLRRLGREAGTTAAIPIGDSPLIGVMMGRTVGGSSTMTGGVCFRVPSSILRHWERVHRLDGYSEERMEPYYRRVETAMRVSETPAELRSRSTALFGEGAARLGYPLKPMRRNMVGCVGMSRCNFGCPRQAKMSVDLSYLPRARAKGARIFADVRVDRVTRRDGRAGGVEGRLLNGPNGSPGARLSVVAPIVVVAAGTVHTPAILRRSRVGVGSGALGRNLTLHPSFRAAAVFDEEVRGWEGALQGAYSDHFEHEGITLNSAFLPLNLLAATVPGAGREYLEDVRRMGRLAVFGALVHDDGGGRLWRGPGREPIITYRLSRRDKSRMLHGIRILARTFFEAGARKVMLPIFGAAPLTSPDQIDAIDERIPAGRLETVSFHPLGTARMGVDDRRAVVSPTGETFDLPGLWVADGSIFPTSIGVNSQLPIMAMATRIAFQLLDRAL